jgi:AraC family transcriptional regulator, regulatory protein of adaptative response / DNA-3-methyladenine glycosylase II
MLDIDICQSARLSRDARFDGKFYTAVLTTGIFCRPVCPARPPKPENVQYYQSAELAQNSGFRPCKRCFPELAPAPLLPEKIKHIVQSYYENNNSIAECAKRQKISERQLQRLFVQYYGLSPSDFFHHQRLLQARKLLTTTQLSMTNIAYASGFNSVRRFNEVIKDAYAVTPTQMRGTKIAKENKTTENCSSEQQNTNTVSIHLSYRPPFDWPLMLSFFRHRQISNIEKVTDTEYCRSFTLENCHGWFKITQPTDKKNYKTKNTLLLTVNMDDFSYLNQVITRVRKMFDLDADMSVIHQHLNSHARLNQVIQKYPGLRLPSCWNIFEFSIRAILGQQISVKAATTLAQRITEKYGTSVIQSNSPYTEMTKHFPTPEQLKQVDYTDIGLTQSRIATLQRWVDYYLATPDVFSKYKNTEALEKTLTQLKGIGPWTVNYIAMRGLSDPDAFPSADLGIIKALTTNEDKPNNKTILEIAEQWRPWRAYATIFLWQSLAIIDHKKISKASTKEK